MTTQAHTLESLLADRDWFRALARTLVLDDARADDVTQEAYLTALRRPPRHGTNLRGWFTKVLRNTARDIGRGEERRTRHEAAATRDRAAAVDTAGIAERVRLQRSVAGAVLDLDEPYRTVLLLRFFEELKPAKIARQLDRPVATVNTQIQRGLEHLRRRLDGEFGARGTWQQALLPFVSLAAPGAGIKLVLWAGLLLLTLGGGGFGLAAWFDGADAETETLALVADDKASAEPDRTESPLARERVADMQDKKAPKARPERPVFRARVVDPQGQPLVGVRIEFDDPQHPRVVDGRTAQIGRYRLSLHPSMRQRWKTVADVRKRVPSCPDPAALLRLVRGEVIPLPNATSKARGVLSLRGPSGFERLSVDAADRLLIGHTKPEKGDHVLVVAPSKPLRGVVRDPLGRALEGVEVVVELGESVTAFDAIESNLKIFHHYSRQTDAGGRFDLGAIPSFAGAELVVRKRGYQTRRFATSELDGRPVAWTLVDEPRPKRRHITGTVRLRNGKAAAGAMLRFGPIEAKADANGAFAFELGATPLKYELIAVLPGHQPAILADLAGRVRSDHRAGENLDLRLGPPPRQITGRLLDKAGEPLAGFHVAVVDATSFGNLNRTVEEFLQAGFGDASVRTDAKGLFRIGGLSSRAYTIRAFEPGTLRVLDGELGPRDATLTIRAPADEVWPKVTGTVVDAAGQPVVGVAVKLEVDIVKRHHFSIGLERPEPVVTDRDGRFEYRDVPHRLTRVSIDDPRFSALTRRVQRTPMRLTVAPKKEQKD